MRVIKGNNGDSEGTQLFRATGNSGGFSSNLCIPFESCLSLMIIFSDTNYKARDEFLCRPRRARKYICPTIARYLLAADIRFVLSQAS